MKSIFAVIVQTNPHLVAAAIQREFPDNFLVLSSNQWLVASTGTAKAVSDQLGLVPGFESTAIVLAVSGYFGLEPPNVWEWIRSKWGSA